MRILLSVHFTVRASLLLYVFALPAGLVSATETEATQEGVKILYQWVPPKCERKVESGDSVRYHYHGMLTDGTYFDSSFERGRTYNTHVDAGWLIPGMDAALLGMCVNEHRIVSIPSRLAYGEEGTDGIPPDATLLFNFVLLDISNDKDTVRVETTYLPADCKRKLVDTDYVRYHYNGTLLNGQPFHSSYEEDSTYDTYVGQGWIIRGMDQGLIGSCMGERRTIIIPPQLAYGARGDEKNIPPASTVRFDIEVIDFHNPKDTAAVESLSKVYEKGEGAEDPCPRRIEESDFIRYHYNASFVDGTVFDSSYRRNSTYDTYVGFRRLIAGMEIGLLGLCVGDRNRITIPPHLGYGERGIEGRIPGSAVLVFDVFIVDVHNPKDDVKIGIVKAPPADCDRMAVDDDFLTYDYELELMDGTKIESSKDSEGQWQTYNGRGMVILGIQRGMTGMCVGEIRRVVVPPHLGFGEAGAGSVPGSAVLIYTIELYKIEEALPEGYMFVWKDKTTAPDGLFELVDEDADGSVTLEELTSYILKECDSGSAKLLPGVAREKVVEDLFKLLDKDEDSTLSVSELAIPLPPQPHHEKVSDEL